MKTTTKLTKENDPVLKAVREYNDANTIKSESNLSFLDSILYNKWVLIRFPLLFTVAALAFVLLY